MTWRFEIYDALTSTLDFCRKRASLNEKAGLVVIAHEQSAARGTRGRKWSSDRGNLALTFLLYEDEEGKLLSVLPFIAALALYDACIESAPISHKIASQFQLKWPNDLLLNGRKLSGILIESGYNERGRWVNVGIGVNLVSAPQLSDRATASFSEIVPPPYNVTFAKLIIKSVTKWLKRWQDEGNDVIYRSWLSYAHPVGSRIRVSRSNDILSGFFNGIDSHGRLLLQQEDGYIIPVATGDVFCL
ncbi:biotin--[acetyl-CoA-carboxylase] ligase [Aristophania vespae]|uniref:biotin--[acetyl-CoA-carboxylase] ligase n=1 Tax=Aristophania vespae TaxID=2697033 RepID=UPI0023513842|nr:biotin--[acetyl-CoA-carboxylase] ligase [Aristophania vespae]UMM63380.1 Bifunctional ligase/repressor BirA [Aristophania vespae]